MDLQTASSLIAMRQLAGDSSLDPKVRRKLSLVLASWHRQFKDDPKMSAVANLYKSVRDPAGLTLYESSDSVRAYQAAQREQQTKRERERLEEKEKLKREKEEAKRKKAAQKLRPQDRPTRRPFNFEQASDAHTSPILYSPFTRRRSRRF